MADLLTWDPKLVDAMRRTSRSDVALVARPQPGVLSLRVPRAGSSNVARSLSLASLPAPNEVLATPLGDCAWVRPDEWLLITELGQAPAAIAELEAIIAVTGGALVDISASRVELELRGARSRDVLAAACPLDLHRRAFNVGSCAQSLLAKAPIFLHLTNGAPRWRILVRPSLAPYVVSWLTDAMTGD